MKILILKVIVAICQFEFPLNGNFEIKMAHFPSKIYFCSFIALALNQELIHGNHVACILLCVS